MTRTEILENNWEEYIEFIRQLSAEMVELEKDKKDTGDLFKLMLHPEEYMDDAKLKMLSEIGENSFWNWWAFVKSAMDKEEKK